MRDAVPVNLESGTRPETTKGSDTQAVLVPVSLIAGVGAGLLTMAFRLARKRADPLRDSALNTLAAAEARQCFVNLAESSRVLLPVVGN